jgi:hypothetical protein
MQQQQQQQHSDWIRNIRDSVVWYGFDVNEYEYEDGVVYNFRCNARVVLIKVQHNNHSLIMVTLDVSHHII